MKKRIHLMLICITLLGLLWACSKDDGTSPNPDPVQQPDPIDQPDPTPVANFVLDPETVQVGIPVMFDNLSLNSSRYEWYFGGQETSSDISPTVTFSGAGSVTVTLKAFSEDGQMAETSMEMQVKERILTGYFVNAFPISNGAEPWDPGLTGAEQFADIFVQLLPVSLNNPNSLSDGIYGNVPTGPFGNIVDSANPDSKIVLTDEDWIFTLFDFDGDDPGDINNGNVEMIIQVQFNPVQAPTFIDKTDDSGLISVMFVDEDGYVLDVDLSFDLQ
ncbi:MAG: hypothetical protein ACR2MT_04135 [Aurantibacter sp.]